MRYWYNIWVREKNGCYTKRSGFVRNIENVAFQAAKDYSEKYKEWWGLTDNDIQIIEEGKIPI